MPWPLAAPESTGQKTATITTSSANTLVFTGAGRFCAVLVATAAIPATNDIIFYDSATAAASGTKVGFLPKSSTLGTFLAFDIPVALGLSVNEAAAASLVLTVVYTQNQ
jgi:hypothetical protein